MTKEPIPVGNRFQESALEFIRWLGFFAAITILAIVLLFPYDFNISSQDWTSIAIPAIFVLLPALASAILSLTRRFWILFFPAVLLGVIGFSLRLHHPERKCLPVFLIAALILFISPLLAWGVRTKHVKDPKL